MKTPRLVRVGTLNQVVRANGNNNDDGNGWSRQVSNDSCPPAPIDKGILALLRGRR